MEKLEALKPTVAITGHGLPMMGALLTDSLRKLVQEFDRIAIPDYGKYVEGETSAYCRIHQYRATYRNISYLEQ